MIVERFSDRARTFAPRASLKGGSPVKAKVLLVEDEAIVAKDIQKILEILGYDVVGIEASGENALQAIERRKPDLVLMDIVLRGKMNGIEAARQIRSRFHTPVVFLTAYADDEVLEQAKKTEPFGYIIKPFEERELRTVIEMVLYRAEMEKKVEEREQWLSTTLESIAEGVIAMNSGGQVTYLNPVAQRLTGYSQEQASGLMLKEMISITGGEPGNEIESQLERVVEEGTIIELPAWILKSDRGAGEILVDLNVSPLKDGEGIIKGMVMVLKDVTARKRVEEELLRAQKLEAAGILAGGIAHEFNNILTAILGNISLAKVQTQKSPELLDCLADAEEASVRAKELAHQLVIFSRGGLPVPKPVLMGDLLKNSTWFASRGSRIQCDFALQQDLWTVDVDPDQMNQVMGNVILNAAQSMPDGGIVHIEAENVEVTGEELPVASLERGRYVQITVKDHGEGIPAGHLSKIFDPFFTTKQLGKGLGLAISYTIIKNHHGHIDIQSIVNAGTTVRIFLPVSTKAIVEPDRIEESLQGGGGRILVMEGEEALQPALRKMLKYLGYKVEFALEGGEAVRMYRHAKSKRRPFDAAILDLHVSSGMGGREAIQHLLEFDPMARCIATSGYSGDCVPEDYESTGFRGCLSKPYDITQLGESIRQVLM